MNEPTAEELSKGLTIAGVVRGATSIEEAAQTIARAIASARDFDLSKLMLNPGDILVFKFGRRIPREVLEHLAAEVKERIPSTPVLVCENGADVGKLCGECPEYENGCAGPFFEACRRPSILAEAFGFDTEEIERRFRARQAPPAGGSGS